MKSILVTGKNSYVGRSFEGWMSKYKNRYSVDTIDMKSKEWKEKDFSKYDAVFHVAGIAHVSSDPKKKELYYRVNRDLTIETAQKAKDEGVKQFIFMSSIIIYGNSSYIEQNRVIDKDTIPEPSDFYGDSKLQAEEGLKRLEDDSFKVVILRPPMIYGRGSRGNYPKLAKLARKIPLFPDIDNQRSMLYIDNLSEFVRLMIDNRESGIFFPQNSEYVKTSEMVRMIGLVHGNKVRLTRIFNRIFIFMGKRFGIINKVFGSLVYKREISRYKEEYARYDFKETLRRTEGG